MAERIFDPRLLVNGYRRKRWFAQVVNQVVENGSIDNGRGERLLDDNQNTDFDKHLRDFFISDIAVHIPSIVTLVGGVGYGLSTGSMEVVGLTVGHMLLPIKIGPGGLARTAWLGFRAVQDHGAKERNPNLLHPLAESANLGLSFFSPVGLGNFSEPIRMASANPDAAIVLALHMRDGVGRAPIIGKTVSRWGVSIFERFTGLQLPGGENELREERKHLWNPIHDERALLSGFLSG